MVRKELKAWMGVAVFLGFSASCAFAQEIPLDDLCNQMTKARGEGKYDVLAPLCDQILARRDSSAETRAQAKLYKVDSMVAKKMPPEKIAEEFAKLETDSDFVGMWPIHLRLNEAQTLCALNGYAEKAAKAAGDGIALIRKAMEASAQKPDMNLWDRMILMADANGVALKQLDRDEDAAELSYTVLKEADEAGVCFRAMTGLIDRSQYFLKMKAPDKALETGAHMLGVVSRTKNTSEVGVAIKRIQDNEPEKAGASAEAKAKLKAALLAVEKIVFSEKEASAGVTVTTQAKALAAKL